MAAYFTNKNLTGFSKWMHVQADEERVTAVLMLDKQLGKRSGE